MTKPATAVPDNAMVHSRRACNCLALAPTSTLPALVASPLVVSQPLFDQTKSKPIKICYEKLQGLKLAIRSHTVLMYVNCIYRQHETSRINKQLVRNPWLELNC